MKSEICKKCADITCYGYDHWITECEDFQPQTNADRIRSMSDEELATFLMDNVDCKYCKMHGPGCSVDCEKWMLDWLKKPAEAKDVC